MASKHGEDKLSAADVGGGMSSLGMQLASGAAGVPMHVTVVDISKAALDASAARAAADGIPAEAMSFLCSDVLAADLAEASLDVWHDRATFHFLGDLDARRQYASLAARAVKPGGVLIVATFDVDGGPERCSGLPVQRWSVAGLAAFFAEFGFVLEAESKELHKTPSGSEQKFVYAVLRRASEA